MKPINLRFILINIDTHIITYWCGWLLLSHICVIISDQVKVISQVHLGQGEKTYNSPVS